MIQEQRFTGLSFVGIIATLGGKEGLFAQCGWFEGDELDWFWGRITEVQGMELRSDSRFRGGCVNSFHAQVHARLTDQLRTLIGSQRSGSPLCLRITSLSLRALCTAMTGRKRWSVSAPLAAMFGQLRVYVLRGGCLNGLRHGHTNDRLQTVMRRRWTSSSRP
jgi:hypothetical protein